MIIVNTTNGAIFINEKKADMVRHNKEKKQVQVFLIEGAELINDVESVTYTTDSQPTTWKDEGSEVGKLKEKYEKLEESYDRLYHEANKQRYIIEQYALSVRRLSPHTQREFLKDEFERLENVVRGRYPEFNVTFGHDDTKSE